ncbi:MAG: DUF86 domain-containing protein [Thermodesulfovibrionales bacterium]|nr:DUF86 domain-containing protein [Thermodesulfovibrionales bacterium]
MPLFNPDKIARLVSEMRKAISRLKSLGTIDKESFLNDPDKIDSAKYNFVIAIESSIDICNHIISQNSYRAPEDYADTFQVLGEHGAFDKDFVKDLKEMARFRNRLIHLYWEVDDEQVYEILQSGLEDFKTFMDRIAAFLKLEKL